MTTPLPDVFGLTRGPDGGLSAISPVRRPHERGLEQIPLLPPQAPRESRGRAPAVRPRLKAPERRRTLPEAQEGLRSDPEVLPWPALATSKNRSAPDKPLKTLDLHNLTNQ